MYEMRERADGNHGIPTSAPKWFRQAAMIHRENSHVPEKTRRALVRQARAEGRIESPPQQAGQWITKYERLMKAMAG
jgi:hypothetical protein